jgi:hypothetical protein
MNDMAADSPTTRREVELDSRVDETGFDNQRYQTTGDPSHLSGDERRARDERVKG